MLSSIFGFFKSFSKEKPVEEKEGDREEWETYFKERNKQFEIRSKFLKEHPGGCIKLKTLFEPKGKCPQDIRDKYKLKREKSE